MVDLLLQPGGCGTDLASTVSRPCAAFVRLAWQPYVRHPHSTCWRVVLPALGIGDLLSMIVPLTAEAMLNYVGLDVLVRDGMAARTAGVNATVLGLLGLLADAPVTPQCGNAHKVVTLSSTTARLISKQWATNAPINDEWRARKLGGATVERMIRTPEPLACLMRIWLCPRGPIQQRVATLKAHLGSGNRSWLAVHARFASASHGFESQFMGELQIALNQFSSRHSKTSPADPSADVARKRDNSHDPRLSHADGLSIRVEPFERFMLSALPHVCDRLLSTSADSSSCTAQRVPCPELCSRIARNTTLGLSETFGMVERALQSEGETRFFFSTDSTSFQRYAQGAFGDRLVLAAGEPLHSGASRAPAFGRASNSEGERAAKTATDFLMFLDARQVIQLFPSSFSAVVSRTAAPSPIAGDRIQILGHCAQALKTCANETHPEPVCDVRSPCRHA